MITQFKIYENHNTLGYIPTETYILVRLLKSSMCQKIGDIVIIKTTHHTADQYKVYYYYEYPNDFCYQNNTLRMIDLEVYPNEYEDDDGNLWEFLFMSKNLRDVKEEFNIYQQSNKYNL